MALVSLLGRIPGVHGRVGREIEIGRGECTVILGFVGRMVSIETFGTL